MEPRPQELTAAVERLREALDGMAAALASGELPRLLAAQEVLLAARLSSQALPGWSDEDRAELRASLRRARAALNGCRRTNHVLLSVVGDFLTGADADYTRHGNLSSDAVHVTSESKISCRV